MPLNVSLFPTVTETRPDLRVGWSFRQLCAALGPPRTYVAKEAAPLYSPAEWLPGAGRGRLQVAAVHFGVLDLDHWTEDAVVELITRLHGRGLAYYLASTWSHGEKGKHDCCARLLVPFSRPVLATEWKRFWGALNDDVTQGRADPKCKDIGRGYYFPSYRDGGEPPFHDENTSGTTVDVDALLSKVGGAATMPYFDEEVVETVGGGLDISIDKIRSVGQRLANTSNSPHRNKIGHALLRVVRGEAYAREPSDKPDPGQAHLPEGRNDTTFKLIATLCEMHPHASPERIASHFAKSVEAMGGEPSVEQIEDMVRRQQSGARTAHAHLIGEAFGTSGRTEPYTTAELQTFADKLDIGLSRMQRRWIIQLGSSYYVFCAGKYWHCGESEISVASNRYLSPAITANVDTLKITSQGSRLKTPQELVQDYGAIAFGCKVDYTAQHDYFDEEQRIMIEAPCPIRVRAKHHPEIARWLELLAGDKHQRLLQWLAVATALREPCAALYLEGARGTGKSLLGYGVAKVWLVDRPTTFDEALADYNEKLGSCPLVLADETVPVDSRGMIRTDKIREFIQARTRPYKRKYKPNATIDGCVRIIMAANNRNLLQTTEHLTKEDIDAIVERIFYLRVREEAKAYLNSLAPGVTTSWVEEDKIAEHVVWLAENTVVPRGKRFLVSGESSDLTRSLTVTTGLRASVCQWLIGYLLNPEKIRSRAIGSLVKVSSGRLLVNAKVIVETWADYVIGDKNVPRPMEVSRALAGFSQEITLRLETGAGVTNQKFRHVEFDDLVEWAEQTGYADRERLETSLRVIEMHANLLNTNTKGDA